MQCCIKPWHWIGAPNVIFNKTMNMVRYSIRKPVEIWQIKKYFKILTKFAVHFYKINISCNVSFQKSSVHNILQILSWGFPKLLVTQISWTSRGILISKRWSAESVIFDTNYASSPAPVQWMDQSCEFKQCFIVIWKILILNSIVVFVVNHCLYLLE